MAQSSSHSKWLHKNVVFIPNTEGKQHVIDWRTGIQNITKGLCKWEQIEVR